MIHNDQHPTQKNLSKLHCITFNFIQFKIWDLLTVLETSGLMKQITNDITTHPIPIIRHCTASYRTTEEDGKPHVLCALV